MSPPSSPPQDASALDACAMAMTSSPDDSPASEKEPPPPAPGGMLAGTEAKAVEEPVGDSASESSLSDIEEREKDVALMDGVVLEGHFAWGVVAASFLVHLFAVGMSYSFGVFLKPMEDSLDMDRATSSWVISLVHFCITGMGAVSGGLADRYGFRRVAAFGGVLMSVALLISSFSVHKSMILLFNGVLFGMGVSFAFLPSIVIISQWFRGKRGLATGIAAAGSGVGNLVLPLVSEEIIQAADWRVALRVMAAAGGVAVLCASVMYKRAVVRVEKSPMVDEAGAPVDMRRVLAADPIFRRLAGASLAGAFGYLIPFAHIVPYAVEQRGLSDTNAALLLSLMGAASMVGRIVLGGMSDRVGQRNMFAFALAVMGVVTVALLPWADNMALLSVYAVVYGLFAGTYIAIIAPLCALYFGIEQMGAVTGYVYSLAAIGALLGSPIAGYLFEATGAYEVSFVMSGVALLLAVPFVMALPAQATTLLHRHSTKVMLRKESMHGIEMV